MLSNILDTGLRVQYTRRQKGGDIMLYRLKELREQRKMSQEELSEKAGVSRQIISLLESGNNEVNTTTATLQKLSAALNCSLSEIFLP